MIEKYFSSNKLEAGKQSTEFDWNIAIDSRSNGNTAIFANEPNVAKAMRYKGGKAPLFVSYFTNNTPYEAEAARLEKSLDKLGLEHRIIGVEPKSSWVENCAMKSSFILEQWQNSSGPICWLDADSEILEVPEFICDTLFDLAITKRDGWYFISFTLFLAKTKFVEELLTTWVRYCQEFPMIWDQLSLSFAWHNSVASHDMSTLWLPESTFEFPKGFVRTARDKVKISLGLKDPAFIKQHQASRKLKAQMSKREKPLDEIASHDLPEKYRDILRAYDFATKIEPEQVIADVKALRAKAKS